MTKRSSYSFWLLFGAATLMQACATSAVIVDNRPPEPSGVDSVAVIATDYAEIDYAATRSRLGDPIRHIENTYPEVYVSRGGSVVSNSRQGFRVQILSTQNRNEAENMLEEYNLWLASQAFSYKGVGYIVFQAPNYRVHVGDFHDRNIAQNYSRSIKDRFPDAWVVADTVNPEKVPDRN